MCDNYVNVFKLTVCQRESLIISFAEVLNLLHGTDPDHAKSIRENGFNLSNFGNTAKMTGSSMGRYDPAGIYFIRDHEKIISNPPHPYDHDKQGEWIRARVYLKNPLVFDSIFPNINGKEIEYKKYLSEKHDGSIGQDLTSKLQADGYDGIITPIEVVVFDPSNVEVIE